MTEVKVKDEGGEEITMIDFGDYRSSKYGQTVDYIVELNKQLPDLKFRDDDILLCSYPKAGCTWTYEILTMLLRGKAEGPSHSKLTSMLEATQQSSLDILSSPRLLNTHLPYRRIPCDIHQKAVKIVLVVRNPKDVAVSLYNMMNGFKHYNYRGKFEHWLPLYMGGDCIPFNVITVIYPLNSVAYDTYWRYYTDWETAFNDRLINNNMIIVYYEDMKQNLLQEVKRLSEFLSCDLDEKVLQDISASCQFNEMKSRHTPDKLGAQGYRAETKQSFMRKGTVGDWRNWFTITQSEKMDALVGDNMADTKFRLIYNLP